MDAEWRFFKLNLTAIKNYTVTIPAYVIFFIAALIQILVDVVAIAGRWWLRVTGAEKHFEDMSKNIGRVFR